jgi:hypothetical protein
MGKEKFKTLIGGFLTIVLIISITIYSIFQSQMMFSFGNTNISIKNLLKDRTTDREVHTPFPNIQLSFIVEKEGEDLVEKGGLVEITVNHVQQTYEYNPSLGMKERKREKTSLEMEK